MTNHPNRRRYYAAQSPRGFSNEVDYYAFSSKSARDAWVAEHASDGDVNAAYCGAYACTKAEALKGGGQGVHNTDSAGFRIPGKPNAALIG